MRRHGRRHHGHGFRRGGFYGGGYPFPVYPDFYGTERIYLMEETDEEKRLKAELAALKAKQGLSGLGALPPEASSFLIGGVVGVAVFHFLFGRKR